MSACPTSDDYYDTPKNIKESLFGEYGNYDTPPPPALALKKVTACLHHNFSALRWEILTDIVLTYEYLKLNQFYNYSIACLQYLKLAYAVWEKIPEYLKK